LLARRAQQHRAVKIDAADSIVVHHLGGTVQRRNRMTVPHRTEIRADLLQPVDQLACPALMAAFGQYGAQVRNVCEAGLVLLLGRIKPIAPGG
jgi:hypothetical protein